MYLGMLHNGVEQVHAFEPVPAMYDLMVKAYGNDSRLIANRLGVSDKKGSVKGARIYNAWTLLPEGTRTDLSIDHANSEPFDFDLTTVDDYVVEKHLKVDLIKIDVDGYEFRVLKGAKYTLETYRPPMLFELSFLPTLIGDNCEEMCKYIFEIGYVVVTMDGKTVVRDWLSLIERFPWRSSFDVMLRPKVRSERPMPNGGSRIARSTLSTNFA
jgi:FkbM family methyltransferase